MKQISKKPQLTKLLKNKVVLITGGAGSLGSAITTEILNYPVKSIRVFDNNEIFLTPEENFYGTSRFY